MVERESTLDERLDPLLTALLGLAPTQRAAALSGVHIVTWRGILTRILCTPYCRNEAWQLAATRHKVRPHARNAGRWVARPVRGRVLN